MVWVRTGKFPAKIIVTQNSPRSRAQLTMLPTRSADQGSGIVRKQKTWGLLAPSKAADCSNSWSVFEKPRVADFI